LNYPFLQHALLCGLLASVSCGIVGSYVVVRRTTYIAGAIAHCVLGGMGAAYYLHTVHEVSWLTPLVGATLAAVIAAVIIGLVSINARQRVDTVLSVIWAIGMAVGISFIMATPGYNQDLMSYLFGNILMVTRADLVLMFCLDVIILLTAILFYNKLLAISFNPEQARLRGIAVSSYEICFLILTALTVVLLVQVVGIVLVIALLTIPAATAAHFTVRLSRMMLVAILLNILYTVGGLALSYQPELPAGATIIELAGAVYLLVLVVKQLARFRATLGRDA
jgi:zinc transport system permease protein